MDKTEIENKLKEAEDILKECKNHLSKIDTKKDYSKFVGRFDKSLCIFVDKNMLKSFDDGTISYNDQCKGYYVDKLNYEIVDFSELKCGDVVCFEPYYNIDELSYTDFGIYVGTNDVETHLFQTLHNMDGVDVINYNVYRYNYKFGKIVRFLRE